MRVLVVEDDPDVSVLLSAWFEGTAQVTLRASAEDVTDDDIYAHDAILADHRMPGMDGCDLLARVAALRPAMRRVLWTAASGGAGCPSADVVVVKPATLTELAAALDG